MTKDTIPCPCDTCELPLGELCILELEISTVDSFTEKEIKSTCLHPTEYIAFIDHMTHEIVGEVIP